MEVFLCKFCAFFVNFVVSAFSKPQRRGDAEEEKTTEDTRPSLSTRRFFFVFFVPSLCSLWLELNFLSVSIHDSYRYFAVNRIVWEWISFRQPADRNEKHYVITEVEGSGMLNLTLAPARRGKKPEPYN
jgi:hypothetical protein